MPHQIEKCVSYTVDVQTHIDSHPYSTQSNVLFKVLLMLVYDKLMLTRNIINKTKVIRVNLIDLDFDFEDIFRFCKISVMVTYQFW